MVFANLSLNIEIVHKKGMDKGLVLVNEVHTIEDFDIDKEKEISISKNWSVSLKAKFQDESKRQGPSEKVLVESVFLKKNKSGVELIKEKDFVIGLGQKIEFEHAQSSDQIIEISITPHVR